MQKLTGLKLVWHSIVELATLHTYSGVLKILNLTLNFKLNPVLQNKITAKFPVTLLVVYCSRVLQYINSICSIHFSLTHTTVAVAIENYSKSGNFLNKPEKFNKF